MACVASYADVLRGSSRVPAGTRDEPLRTSAGEAIACAAGAKMGGQGEREGEKLER